MVDAAGACLGFRKNDRVEGAGPAELWSHPDRFFRKGGALGPVTEVAQHVREARGQVGLIEIA